MHDAADHPEPNNALRTVSLVFLTLNIGVTAAVALGVYRSLRTFPPIFEDFELELPWITRVMLTPWTIAVLLVFVVLGIFKELVFENRQTTLIFKCES